MVFFFIKLFSRHFKRYRLYHMINLFGLSLGLAAVIMIGGWIEFHLSFDTYYSNHQQLFRVIQILREGEQAEWVAPTPTPLAGILKNTVPGIENACRIHYGANLIISGNGEVSTEKKAIYTDASFFDMFDLDFIYYDAPSLTSTCYVMLSESTAKKYFGTPDASGKLLTLADQQQIMVAGIFRDLPGNSHFDFEMILPLSLAIDFGHEIFPETWHDYDEIYTYVEVSRQADPDRIGRQISGLKSNYMEENQDEFVLQPVTGIHTRTDLNYDMAITIEMNKIFIFSAIAALLLLISISNYVIFTIALSSSRFKEISIRKISGASVKNLITGQLLSGLILTFFAILLGLIQIEIFAPIIQRFFQYPLEGFYLRLPLWIFFGLLFLLITLLIGLFPGLQLIGINPLSFIKPMENSDFNRNRILHYLVIFQFTISLTLLIFAAGIQDQLTFIRNADVGFEKERLISIPLYDQSKEILWNHLDAVLSEMKDQPAIEEVTFSCSSPSVVGTSAGEADWEGREAGRSMLVQWNSVFYNYFQTIGAEMLAGSDFSENYTHQLASEQSASFVLNEAALREMGMSPGSAINRSFELYGRKGPIIGVVKDFHFKSFHEAIQPMAFFMHPYYYNNIILRIRKGKPDALSSISMVYKKYFPDIPLEYSFVSDEFQSIYQGEKDLLIYNTGFALLIVLISAMGLSSLAMLLVHKKTKEIGIRKINGASTWDIYRLYMTYFGKWILTAILIAFPISAWLISHWLENFAYRTSLKLQFFVLPILFMVLISLLSVLVQVTQASRANPVEALKYE